MTTPSNQAEVLDEKGLAQCPFCEQGTRSAPVASASFMGTAAELGTREDQWLHQVRCCCGASGPEAPTKAEAVEAWNRRAYLAASAPDTGVEALREAIKSLEAVQTAALDEDSNGYPDFYEIAARGILKLKAIQSAALASPSVGGAGEPTDAEFEQAVDDAWTKAQAANTRVIGKVHPPASPPVSGLEPVAGLVERLRAEADNMMYNEDFDGPEDAADLMRKAAIVLETSASTIALLEDPNAVHINMLRGTTAKPSFEQIKHIYAAEFEAAGALLEGRVREAVRERDKLVLSTGEHITRRSELLARAEAAEARLAEALAALDELAELASGFIPLCDKNSALEKAVARARTVHNTIASTPAGEDGNHA